MIIDFVKKKIEIATTKISSFVFPQKIIGPFFVKIMKLNRGSIFISGATDGNSNPICSVNVSYTCAKCNKACRNLRNDMNYNLLPRHVLSLCNSCFEK